MESLILTIIATSIPLLLAATGELIAEKSGVLNLGVEGMMLSGAVGALGAVLWLENPYYGIVAGALSGVLMASIFSIFTINFMTNQVATGLGLTIFAIGLTGLAGAPLIGKTIPSLPKIEIFLFSDIPLVGNILFKQDFVAYLSIAIIIFISFFLKYSKSGIILRAVGDDHQSAHSVGYPVKRIRWYATSFGGVCAGIGGAYIPLALTPHWAEEMTAGRGWIALALVVFASWIPWRIIVGALIFGGITIAQLVGQARGWPIPSQLLSMMPYLATIIALTVISGRLSKNHSVVPSSLGKPFFGSQ
jgi:simple sugar transport system permease protein